MSSYTDLLKFLETANTKKARLLKNCELTILNEIYRLTIRVVLSYIFYLLTTYCNSRQHSAGQGRPPLDAAIIKRDVFKDI